ncbi:hypothetical protein ACI3PS_05200, partial [Glaesserella parasuis]|nr:hypothetical protein [Glaesserella parasuis]
RTWNVLMKIYYLFDPLCGWCYGASATLQKLNEIYPLALAPTGLFYQSGRKMDADFARYAWDNDQRLHIVPSQLLYGEVQGLEDYLKQLS